MRILGIGEAVVDSTSVVDANQNKTTPTKYDAGGPVLSALTLLSRLGISCEFVTSLGDDNDAQYIKQHLSSEGIALNEYRRPKTKHHRILVNAQTGQREKQRAQHAHAPIQNLDPAYLRSFDLILLDRHEQHAFAEIKEYAPNTPIVIDPSTEVSDFTKSMMTHASHPILPIESLGVIGAKKTLPEALAATYSLCQKTFIITLGHLGSLVYNGQRPEFIAPLDVTAVDTNGAGDVYRGAFAYAYLQRWDTLASAHYANTAAALQCTKSGNAAAIPSKSTIATALLHTPRRTVDIAAIVAYFTEVGGGASPEASHTFSVHNTLKEVPLPC